MSKLFNPYAHIDWEKAATLFTKAEISLQRKQQYPQVKDFLGYLMKAGEAGLTFIFEAHKRGAEQLHPGLDLDWRYKQMIRQMEKQRFLKIKNNPDGSLTVTVQKKGMIRALTYQLDAMTLSRSSKWDGKWRVVLFDIPITHNRLRDIFRARLMQLGLMKLQESVYVSPYSCFDEIEFLRELYGIPLTARYLLVEKIEDDEALRQHFNIH